MPGAAYRSLQNPDAYEALRAKGMSKEEAARISNARAPGHHVAKSGFGVEHVAKADRRTKEEAGAAVGTAVVGNEVRGAVATHREGSLGRQLSDAPPGRHFPKRKGISNAPVGTKISQATHPEGTYHVSTASLASYGNSPTKSSGMGQLADSIKHKGVNRPVQLRVYDNGARLWDGNHRLRVATDQGHKSIPTSVTHVHGNMPKPKSITEGVNELRHRRYRAQQVQAVTRLVKRGEPMISAFGVEHVEIEKIGFAAVKPVAQAMKSGLKGGVNLGHAGTAASGAFKTGKFLRVNAAPLAVGGGAGLGAGAFAASRRNS